jgi:hypothetical protein
MSRKLVIFCRRSSLQCRGKWRDSGGADDLTLRPECHFRRQLIFAAADNRRTQRFVRARRANCRSCADSWGTDRIVAALVLSLMGDAGVIPTPVAPTTRFVDLQYLQAAEINECLVEIGSLKADAHLLRVSSSTIVRVKSHWRIHALRVKTAGSWAEC